jgi:hypothetical protein
MNASFLSDLESQGSFFPQVYIYVLLGGIDLERSIGE